MDQAQLKVGENILLQVMVLINGRLGIDLI